MKNKLAAQMKTLLLQVDDGFLEYINNMLTVGMVPALFARQ